MAEKHSYKHTVTDIPVLEALTLHLRVRLQRALRGKPKRSFSFGVGMTPFPPIEQVQFLLNGDAWIDQVTINASSVVFNFANGCRIEAGTVIEYIDELAERTVHDREWFDSGPIKFHDLLETPLSVVDTEHLRLTLTFEGGRQLIVHSDLAAYEAGGVLGPPNSNVGFYF